MICIRGSKSDSQGIPHTKYYIYTLAQVVLLTFTQSLLYFERNGQKNGKIDTVNYWLIELTYHPDIFEQLS